MQINITILLILLIVVALIGAPIEHLLLMTVLFMGIVWIWYRSRDSEEHMEVDDGNIEEVDPLAHRTQYFEDGEDNEDDFDNADVIEGYIRESQTFQPPGEMGTTAAHSPDLSAWQLGEKGDIPSSEIPLHPRGAASTYDELLARKQNQRGLLNKRAMDGAVRNTRYSFDKYFRHELDQQEDREWWGSDRARYETPFRPYD